MAKMLGRWWWWWWWCGGIVSLCVRVFFAQARWRLGNFCYQLYIFVDWDVFFVSKYVKNLKDNNCSSIEIETNKASSWQQEFPYFSRQKGYIKTIAVHS